MFLNFGNIIIGFRDLEASGGNKNVPLQEKFYNYQNFNSNFKLLLPISTGIFFEKIKMNNKMT